MKRIIQWLLCLSSLSAYAQTADTMSITGTIKGGGILISDGILMAIDPSHNKTSIAKVANGIIDIDSLAKSSYYLYAIPNPFQPSNYLPTYFISRVDATQATLIDLYAPISDLNINLQARTASETGTAALNGRFYYYDVGNDAGTDFSKKWFNTPTPPTVISIPGNSCNSLPVLLYNSQNQIVAWTITDTQGYFQFRNLAGGTYYAKGQRNGYMNWNDGFIDIAASTTAESTFRLYKNIATEIENHPLEEQSITLFPNPFKEQFQIMARGRIVVTDVSGNVWYDQDHASDQSVDGSAWPQGLYFVKTGNKVQKLIKR